MATGIMRSVERLEQRGANRGRESHPERAALGDHLAELYGVARMWKSITIRFYVVALVLMLVPVGAAVRFVGVIFWSVGLLPLVSWQVSRMLFKKAVKQASSAS